MIVFDTEVVKFLFGVEANSFFKMFESKSNKFFNGRSVLLILFEVLFLVDNFHKGVPFWENETLQIINRAVVIKRFIVLIISRLCTLTKLQRHLILSIKLT